MPRISSKNQVTLPVEALKQAGLHSGDEVLVTAVGDGELTVTKAEIAMERAFGSLTGVYPPNYLEQLDAEEDEFEREKDDARRRRRRR